MKQTFEELIKPYIYSADELSSPDAQCVSPNAVLNLLVQVREATIQECKNKIQVEHRVYNVDITYKSELLGEQVIYDLSKPWDCFSTNVKELDNLDKDSIEI